MNNEVKLAFTIEAKKAVFESHKKDMSMCDDCPNRAEIKDWTGDEVNGGFETEIECIASSYSECLFVGDVDAELECFFSNVGIDNE